MIFPSKGITDKWTFHHLSKVKFCGFHPNAIYNKSEKQWHIQSRGLSWLYLFYLPLWLPAFSRFLATGHADLLIHPM